MSRCYLCYREIDGLLLSTARDIETQVCYGLCRFHLENYKHLGSNVVLEEIKEEECAEIKKS